MRLRAVPRSGGRNALQARFAGDVLFFAATASGRNLARVLAAGGVGRGVMGDDTAVAAGTRRRVCERALRVPEGGTGALWAAERGRAVRRAFRSATGYRRVGA